MRLISLAFILSITLHFLFFSSYKKVKDELKAPPSSTKNPSDEKKNSSVKYVRLIQKPVKKTTKKKEVKKLNKKLKEYKKVKKISPQKKVVKKQKAKKILPKPSKKVEVKPSFTKQMPVKPQKKRDTVQKNSLENFFLAEPVPLDLNMLDTVTRRYIKLYGEEYQSFTKVQKVFLQNNLKNIGRITEKYLRYPRIAVRTGQQGTNIVEFFLHPNGDISDLRLIDSSGYTVLDKNSVDTIEIAYKDYPRPKTKTKIRIYVGYKLY